MTGGLDAHLVVRRPSGFELDARLEIPAGTTAALLGPNGSGKSTAVEALAGILALDDGGIRLAGRVLDDPGADAFVPPQERGVGVVFQGYLLFEHLDVRDNIAFGPMSCGVSRRSARARADEWIERFDLSGLADRHPNQLSGGQAQRVALARALAIDPAMVLLDEPLAALDVASRATLRRTVAEHAARVDGPRLLITHDPSEAFLLADRIHVLEDGRITQVGTPDEIRRRPVTPYVAALAGLNLLTGRNEGGRLTVDGTDQGLTTADRHTAGPVVITVHPNAISVHLDEPHGSPRNSWRTVIAAVEPLGEITRLTVDAPIALGIDVTPASVGSMGLSPGLEVWVSVKATEVDVRPA
ncbi:MAG: ATP-binding cassette domain-containing protein [Actinomycetota bacterium]